jgi:hypothetical protein
MENISVESKTVLIEFKGRASQKEFNFKQIRREGDVALFEKRDILQPEIVYYEAIHIRKFNAYSMGGVDFPAGERYPSDREFGIYGWCCGSLELAEIRFEEFLIKIKNNEEE